MSIYDKASLVHIPSGVKSGTLYNVLPNTADGDFDFTRGSTATRVNKDGLIETVASGVPRLDYPLLDGVVQDCPTLLLEPQRTNLQVYSQEFDNAAWSKDNVTVTANNVISPDGSQNADTLVENTSTSRHRISDQVTTSVGSYTYSLFAKSSNRNLVINANTLIGARAGFDLSNGTIGNVYSGTASIEDYGNGWYRCSVTGTSSGTTTAVYLQMQTGYVDENYTGDGVSNISFYGAQIEAGSYPTSYIPTNGSTITRSADVCNGAGTSDTFNDSEGVLYVDSAALADDGANRQMTVYGTGGNSVRLYYHTTSNTIRLLIQGGGTTKVDEIYTTGDITLFHKIAGKYKDGDTALWINGFEVETSNATLSISGLSSLNLETSSGGTNVFLSKIKEIGYYDAVLTDAELEALTSYTSFTNMANELNLTIK